MSDSVLNWMHKNERRYQKRESQHVSTNSPSTTASSQAKLRKLSPKLQNSQNSLDHFLEHVSKNRNELEPESTLFDDEFSLSDFRSLTQQWVEDNLITS
ncbi:MAG: hypothetical protein ACTSYI_06440 [Promethearchaeota archaeon]